VKPLLNLALVALGVIALVEAVSLAGLLVIRKGQRLDDEIRWLEGFEPIRVWDPGRHATIERRYRDRIERELRAGRLDKAVVAVRVARGRARTRGERLDPSVIELGLETYTRAADRMQRAGRFDLAADWNDSLFVFAVRDPALRVRSAATAAFIEGLGLRVRDGKPCDALARVAWAKRGLGGEIPGFDPALEEDLNLRCTKAKRGGRTR
jgi:hypothetical protein